VAVTKVMLMGRIFRDLKVHGSKGERVFEHVLLDSGASFSVMREDVARDLCEIMPFFDKDGKEIKRLVSLPDGEHDLSAIGTCTFQTFIDGREVRDEAWVVTKLNRDFILGAHTLQEGNIKLVHSKKEDGGDRIELGEIDAVELWCI
jgi:hypothetical protein